MIVPFVKSSETRATAILSPREKSLFFEQLNTDYQIRFDFLYQTAMRLREAEYFAEHPEIYRPDNGIIALPRVNGMGKGFCTITQRNISLSYKGVEAVEEFISRKMTIPSYQAMLGVCKRAAGDADIKPDGMVPKMFRKMAVSYLVAIYPQQLMNIAMSVGHDYNTMQTYYLTSGWKKEDLERMKVDFYGWGVAR